MLSHMRTSVDLPEPLLLRAKRLARKRKTTLRSLLEEGLRAVLEKETSTTPRYHYLDCSFGEGGLVKGQSFDDWSSLRAQIYEGRGG